MLTRGLDGILNQHEMGHIIANPVVPGLVDMQLRCTLHHHLLCIQNDRLYLFRLCFEVAGHHLRNNLPVAVTYFHPHWYCEAHSPVDPAELPPAQSSS